LLSSTNDDETPDHDPLASEEEGEEKAAGRAREYS